MLPLDHCYLNFSWGETTNVCLLILDGRRYTKVQFLSSTWWAGWIHGAFSQCVGDTRLAASLQSPTPSIGRYIMESRCQSAFYSQDDLCWERDLKSPFFHPLGNAHSCISTDLAGTLPVCSSCHGYQAQTQDGIMIHLEKKKKTSNSHIFCHLCQMSSSLFLS